MAVKGKTISNPVTGQSIRFLQTKNSSGGRLLEMESEYCAGSVEPAPHYHPAQAEDFRIISGEMKIRLAGKLLTLRAGDVLHIPANKVHSMWNEGQASAVVNWQVRPAMDTEYLLETTFGLANAGKTDARGMPGILQVSLTAGKFTKVFRITKPPFIVQKVLFSILAPVARLKGLRAWYPEYISGSDDE